MFGLFKSNDKSKRAGDTSTNAAPGDSAHLLGNGAQHRELEELILKLDLIEKECVQDKLNEEKEAIKDEFVALKREMYRIIMEVKDRIRSRHLLQKEKGNTVEVIQKGSQIQQGLTVLDGHFSKIKEVFKRQIKQRGKKFTDEQLDQRFKEMQVMKQQIEEARALYSNAAIYSETEIKTLTDFRSQMKVAGVALPAPQEWRDPTSEEQGAMDKWRLRDQDFDKQIGEIGDGIDRLGELAIQLGEKADLQAEVVAGLHRQADEANESLQNINSKIKELLVKQGGMNFFCKLILAMILLGLIGYIISAVNKRISVG